MIIIHVHCQGPLVQWFAPRSKRKVADSIPGDQWLFRTVGACQDSIRLFGHRRFKQDTFTLTFYLMQSFPTVHRWQQSSKP